MTCDRMLRQTQMRLAQADETLRQSAVIFESSQKRVWASRQILPDLTTLKRDFDETNATHD